MLAAPPLRAPSDELALETMKQTDSQLMMRNDEGFLK